MLDKYLHKHFLVRVYTLLISISILLSFFGIIYLNSRIMGIFFSQKLSYFYQKSPEQVLSQIRKDIIPAVAQVRCSDADGGPETIVGSGIYFLNEKGIPSVQTNAHVVLGLDEKFHGCNIYFPKPTDGTFYDTSYFSKKAVLYHNKIAKIETSKSKIEGLDLAVLTIEKANKNLNGETYAMPPKVKDVFKSVSNMCSGSKSIEIGDKIFIIGYPTTGGESVTLTEGVVSGFQGGEDNRIKISASTNHGNSGGIAIGQNNGCYYGLVESATFEAGSNLGYIIPSSTIKLFLENITDLKTESLPATNTKPSQFLKNKINYGNIKIYYPLGWTTSSSTNANKTVSIMLLSPYESKLDNFSETFVISKSNIGYQSEEVAIKNKISELIVALGDMGISKQETSQFTLGNIGKAVSIRFYDKDGQLFNSPAFVEEVVFVNKEILYLVTTPIFSANLLENYSYIFNSIFDSITSN